MLWTVVGSENQPEQRSQSAQNIGGIQRLLESLADRLQDFEVSHTYLASSGTGLSISGRYPIVTLTSDACESFVRLGTRSVNPASTTHTPQRFPSGLAARSEHHAPVRTGICTLLSVTHITPAHRQQQQER